MKRLLRIPSIGFALVTMLALSSTPSVARADEIDTRRLLHGPERCDHVIRLVVKHGVNNDHVTPAGVAGFYPHGPFHIPAAEIGDLQLISVHRSNHVAAGCGPTFDVVVKNCSTREVCGTRITLVGLLGRIVPTSPNATVKIASIAPGQAVQLSVTLPIESLAMGYYGSQPVGMTRLLVVVDSFDQFVEANEANNLRLFELAHIPVAVPAAAAPAAIESTSETVSAPAQPAQPNVAQPNAAQPQAAPAQTAPAQPSAQDAESNESAEQPISNTDLRSAINQFSDGALETK